MISNYITNAELWLQNINIFDLYHINLIKAVEILWPINTVSTALFHKSMVSL